MSQIPRHLPRNAAFPATVGDEGTRENDDGTHGIDARTRRIDDRTRLSTNEPGVPQAVGMKGKRASGKPDPGSRPPPECRFAE
jgi:hypothetical protein